MPQEDATDIKVETSDEQAKPSPVWQLAFWILVPVLFFIGFITIATFYFMWLHFPTAPAYGSSKDVLESYSTLIKILIDSLKEIYQTTVMQSLIPIVTLILGHIFTKRD